jgi:hypothetical protein
MTDKIKGKIAAPTSLARNDDQYHKRRVHLVTTDVRVFRCHCEEGQSLNEAIYVGNSRRHCESTKSMKQSMLLRKDCHILSGFARRTRQKIYDFVLPLHKKTLREIEVFIKLC